MGLISNQLIDNQRGILCILGAFLIQMCAGGFHGTFGNMLPYLTSYMRQGSPHLTNGDLATIFSTGGTFQGFSSLLGGLIVVPILGTRKSLILVCVTYTLAPVLAFFLLDTSVELISVTYGVLSAMSVNFILLLTFVIPATWFPAEHRGKVCGIVNSGFGLSPTVFSPIQSLLVNPKNIPPETAENSTVAYFTDQDVLTNVPPALLYMSAIYTAVFIIGVCLAVERPSEKKKEDIELKQRLFNAMKYFKEETLTRRDFYLLWVARFFYLMIAASTLSHWKTFSYTKSADDKLVSITGGLGGVFSFISRIFFGILLDKIPFNRLMPMISLLLSVVLSSIYFLGQISFIGIIACVWCLYMLAFANFSTIPAQALVLFPGPNSSIVVGGILLAESFAFIVLSIVNKWVMSAENDSMYLTLFLMLAGSSLITIPATWFVSAKSPTINDENKNKM